jgi:hypothetical protein
MNRYKNARAFLDYLLLSISVMEQGESRKDVVHFFVNNIFRFFYKQVRGFGTFGVYAGEINSYRNGSDAACLYK